ncbi:MAG: DUF371 domain-containing protein [Euryarchaeota archaeon]|jgi:uncharacterized protein|nr:DUF371 domain-containing protein [Euryarchaeota archaeon]
MLSDTIHAKGHRNILATHKTTLQITKEDHISKRADCIVAVSADKSLRDLARDIKTALSTNAARIRLTIQAGNMSEVITGFGSAALSLSDTDDMVVRKSGFVSGRTLMIGADKAARDLDRAFVDKLKTSEDITITIEADF